MPCCLHPRETWRSRRHLKRLDQEAARLSIAIPQGKRASRSHVVHVHSCECLGERKDSRVLFENQPHGWSGEELEMAGLAQKHDPESVVQLGVGDDDAFDWYVANHCWNRTGEAVKLLMDIG
jgi:hypothetical protein